MKLLMKEDLSVIKLPGATGMGGALLSGGLVWLGLGGVGAGADVFTPGLSGGGAMAIAAY